MQEKKRTKLTFAAGIANVSLSYLLELMITLQPYKDGLVLVGGWVPFLLLEQFQKDKTEFKHIGSKDIDIAINSAVISEGSYAKIVDLLKERGYLLKPGTQYSYIKHVATELGEDVIQVDFLAQEFGGTGKGHRHQIVQGDFFARKGQGVDIAFINPVEQVLAGELPNKAKAQIAFHIADIASIITMKGYALDSRYKEKDAYDIYSLIKYYKEGPKSVAEEIKPLLTNDIVKRSITMVKEEFYNRDSRGTVFVADFLDEAGEAREQILTDAYLQVKKFIDLVFA